MSRVTLFFVSVAILLAPAYSTHAQGTFVNLDFEAASVQDVPFPGSGELVQVSNGVPGWDIFPSLGGQMGHNTLPLGGALVSILGPNWPSSQILQGSYTVELFVSTAGPSTTPSIFQTGQIPAGSRSIRFYGAGFFGLTFAGHSIPLTPAGSGTNYAIFGGDISSFAGQTGQLVFTGNGLLDNITFSPTPIPEPSVVCLSALGAFLIVFRFQRRRGRRKI